MKRLMGFICLGVFTLVTAPVFAGTINGDVNGSAAANLSRVVALSADGAVVDTATIDSNGEFQLSWTGSTPVSLQFIDNDNQYAGPAIATCNKSLKNLGCPFTTSSVGVGFSGKKTNEINFQTKNGFFRFKTKTLPQYKQTKKTMRARASSGAPVGANSLGLDEGTVSLINTSNAVDPNRDGIPNPYSVDDDGDGILDNYDLVDNNPTGSSSLAATGTEITPLFSNLKLAIESSLNANTGTVPTSTEIDAALSAFGTLAMEVMGDSGVGDTVELDCGTLSYCSTGGTGDSGGAFPDTFDSDVDGKGTITPGGTGDFQLTHGANSSQIQAGDTFVQEVLSTDTSVTLVPGMLNFVFHTTPAVNSDPATDIVYPAVAGMLGSNGNCISVPASGAVSLTIEAWRPQRPGNTGAGESALMDIGGSLVTIDIPNLPCSGGGACSGTGPGNCAIGNYSEADPNLTTGSSSLQDNFVDAAADPANTFTFTIDLVACLDSDPWASGEKLFVDLQMRSPDGDNAAQKFCVQRL